MKLTLPQIDLFCSLVQNEQDGRLFLPIRPIPASADEYVVYLKGRPNLRFRDYGDIDALCVVGLLSYKMGRMGINKEYAITKLGRQLFLSGSLDEELELERVDVYAKRTVDLKAALNLMMAGEALHRALNEVRYVNEQLKLPAPSPKRIQLALQHINEMIAARFAYVTLAEAVATAAAFGAWCEAIAEMVSD